ncbi:MAG: multicopper oxidase domain-containing protein [Thermodesulfobacteriota bacterium]
MRRNRFLKLLSVAGAIVALFWGAAPVQAAPLTGPGTVPDYFETPNWANSPPLTKFLDTLPPLCGAVGVAANNLGQCLPVAIPDQTTYPGSDYYEIELVEYREQMHSEFDPVVSGVTGDKIVVGSGGSATSGGTLLRGYRQVNTTNADLLTPHYLGPVIITEKDRPVRVKFINSLPTGAGGNLFVPVDTSIMGSGEFQINYNPVTMASTGLVSGNFTQNRATLHLHGGRTPWISDGTPHQWITPAGETTSYPRGVSVKNVPDMPDPGPGAETFYWTNQQSSRFMFYHDHAWGITRLNVYVGEAAGYLIRDNVELALRDGGTVNGRTYSGGTIPSAEIPLVIQDKTFVDPLTIRAGTSPYGGTDPTWAWGSNPGGAPVKGDLWWPHVYMPAQNPYNPDMSGINAMGRWHYGPWFFPSTPVCGSVPDAVPPFCINNGPVANPYYDPNCDPATSPTGFCQPPEIPGTPNVSWGAEAFLDTMMVNGTVYPKLDVLAQKYRFRILNASHDRFLNLQLYRAVPILSGVTVTSGGTGYTSAPTVTITPAPGDTIGKGATATATVAGGMVTAIDLTTVGSGYTADPIVTITGGGGAGAAATTGRWTQLTEVGMVPAQPTSGYPATWPVDGREGGAPDPDTRGPAFVQIGTEGGFLPGPVVLPNNPVNWNLDPTMFNVGNVLQQRDGGGTLFVGPAERADVIVDFSQFAGQTLILYNDAPTAFPALDPHYDYYTGAPDRTDMGGYVAIPPGVGPNVRTVMQIVVGGAGGTSPVDYYDTANFAALQAAFATDATTPGVFAAGQDPIVVGQAAYNTTYNTTFPATWPNWGVSRISDGAISFKRVDGTIESNFRMKPKAIHDEMGETFDDYGRMSAKLGLELPFTNAAIQNFILQNYVDPSTEKLTPGETQIWRITHNGVDTHPIHFHLFDVQVLNRVGWDGFIRLPDDNELGWKDTVRIAPLEDTIVALKVRVPTVPFAQPNSVRPLNPMRPINTGDMMGFSQIDITDGADLVPPQTNVLANFGHEYVWHCHILSHEENDMMRPVIVNPDQLLYAASAGAGLRQWELGVWKQIDPAVPAKMVASGPFMFASITGSGLWQWDGTAWTKIDNGNPASMAASGRILYAGFTGAGLYKWDGTAWTRIDKGVPANMAVSGSTLYASFTGAGVYKWTGTAWSRIDKGVPTNMVASDTALYATFTGAGLYKWNGTAWSRIDKGIPAIMEASDTALYAGFTGAGLYKWNGTAWSRIDKGVPTTLATAGSVLYAGFSGAGLYKYDGTAWSRVETVVPTLLASGL